ncbi:Ig-like domain-containing protein [Syntrophomonas wolfei]|uniref:SLH domain-containing protein n=1 Tax=Syntrophomonas wolfei subsp. wolfei (strain DSM 2245B / Goettingen) TaxID=335541 RepID=Q0AYX7_SYNWW|nr:Ig-like domain-containing protein [Syntrophomonas wolfei]ABI68077.1 hypothetical protein Swol_0755 [Syntrophomonas wolfei subsp. wolfei str. Goettingen G311]
MNMKKISLIPELIALIVISLFSVFLLAVPVSAAETMGTGSKDKVYSDLNKSNPNFNYIKYLSQRGIIAGFPDGSFQPEESLSRAQAAVMLVKAMGLEAKPTNEKVFRDVEKDYWASPYIASCVKAGYIKGYPDGSFQPEEKLSRAQGISLVLRLSKQDMNRASLPLIEDVNHEHWAARHIATGLAAEMVELDRSGNKFLPDSPFSRQEMCRALGMLLTQDPDHYACELKGKLVVESGEIILKRAGQSRKVEKSEIIVKGDIIESGLGGSAVINYSDGSSILMKENSVISIIDSRGRSYILKDGNPSVAVDWLNFKIDKGEVFTALATIAAEPGQEKAEENKTTGLTTLLAAGDSSRYIAAAEKSTPPWYNTAQQKKVKVKVDMPYGVAAVRGTIIMISIGSDGRCNVSCLSGNAELSSGGGTVNLNGGQSSGLTQQGAPPLPPGPWTPQQQQLFQNVQQWIQQTQQQMQQLLENPPPPPPPAPQAPQAPPPPPVGPGQISTPDTGGGGGGSGGGGSGGGSGGGENPPLIQSIANISANVIKGQSYQPPATVTAIMTNGTSQQVAISWDNNSPDTSNIGVIILSGSVAGYATTVTLTLTVESSSPIARIDDLNATVEEEQPFELPASVTAILEDGNSRQVEVNWDTDNIDTDQPGIVILNGTVEGYSGTIKLTINVKPRVNIKQIEDIAVEIKVGDSFSLPTQVAALMSDDSTKQVDISWTPSSVDSSKAGNYEFEGTVEGYSKTVKLKLKIEPGVSIKKIDDIKVEIKVGDSYSLPAQVEALMSDDSTKQVDISWTPSSVDSSKAGNYEFEGTVEGYSKTVKLKLKIEPGVSIKKIDDIKVEIKVGDSYSLPAQVEALMSDDSTKEVDISWTPSSVDSSKAGNYEFEGTVEGYSKTVKLKLKIEPGVSIKKIDDIKVEIQVGDSFNLPTQVAALMSDDSTKQVPISWTPSTVKTDVAGSFSFSGQVEGYASAVSLLLTVKAIPPPPPPPPPPPSIKKIEDIAVEIQVGDSFNLPTQVAALMSDDSTKQVPISWTPSTVNTDMAGSFSFSGQVEGYSSAVSLLLTVKAIPPPQLDPPIAIPTEGTYPIPQELILSCENGAIIYFTTDGSDPRTSGTRIIYNGAFTISTNTTIKAYAKKEGMVDSEVVCFTYKVAFKLDAVFLSYDLSKCSHFWGDLLFFFNAPVDPSTIGIDNLIPGATEPVQVNLLAQNGDPLFADLGLGSFSTDFAFSGSGNFYLKGNAYLSSDRQFLVINMYGDADEGSFTLGQGQFTPNSSIKSAQGISLDSNPLQCTSAQVISPVPGSICSTSPTIICGSTASNQPINNVKVEIITLDASSPRYLRPDNNGWCFGEEEYRIPLTSTGPSDNPWSTWSLNLNQAQQEAILATEPNVCYITVWVELPNISGPLTNIGRFTIQTQDQVAAPTANPPAGTYSTAQSVSLSSETIDASIFCTIDGSDPKTSSSRMIFNGAITISTDTTIKAYAKKEGMADSDVVSFSYTIEAPSVGAYVYSVTPTTLYEDMNSDPNYAGGRLAYYYLYSGFDYPGIIVSIANGTLNENISISDYVYQHNLPAGLSVGSVLLLSPSKLYIAIDGQAESHDANNSISDLSFTIAQSAVNGATDDLTTGPISIIFNPDFTYISSVGPYMLYESQENGGTLDPDCQHIYVYIANGSMKQDISKNHVIAHNLPAGFNYEIWAEECYGEYYIDIKITDNANNHSFSDSIDNLYFTIDKEAVNGANDDLITGPISITFYDYPLP